MITLVGVTGFCKVEVEIYRVKLNLAGTLTTSLFLLSVGKFLRRSTGKTIVTLCLRFTRAV